jgi:hypothetical protein
LANRTELIVDLKNPNAILIIGVIFVLEWFQIVDVPFFGISDFMSGKKDMIHSTEDALEQLK